MKILEFNFHDEMEEKVLMAFLNSLKYDYRPLEDDSQLNLSNEDVEGLLKTKQDFLGGHSKSRTWNHIKCDLKGV